MSGNIHDSFFMGLFSVRENLQDLIRGTLPPEILGKVRLDTLEYDPTEYVDREMDSYFRDICCNLRYGKKQIKISLLYEHKSHPVKHVHLQLLRYILNVWEDQADNRLELTPVICIVFYHGKQRWAYTELLKNVSRELRRYVPMFDFVFFDTKDVEDHTIKKHFKIPDVRIGVWFLKQNVDLIWFIRDNPSLAREILLDIRNIREDSIRRLIVYLYNVSGETPEEIDKVMKTASRETDDFVDVFRAKYVEEGIKQGLQRTARNMITKGYSDKQISEITNLSVEQIQDLRKE